ncbi:asparagine synthase-related protein [Sphingomonas sp. BIUV-7]|uniref:asparagine synthase (glutamine-hydrolyzing) n=1 Tax=Sphingomonas natans TaxID=3063330 RepID=A0ABT8YCM2_9SPHN|nr:asparagine synthase-related protein [Sphingomonas sp. BIUV-7]MDO6416101.1 asparagine synthase-related protein [Sphingomonas sp. BIUV-7]
MTRDRYVAIITQTGTPRAAVGAAIARMSRLASFRLLLERDGLVVASTAVAPTMVSDDGIILGALFTRHPIAPRTVLHPDAQTAILRSRGAHLIGAYWGGYIAMIAAPHPDGVAIIRAPLGDLPCYWVERDGMTIVASDMDALLSIVGAPARIHWPAVSRQLLFGDLRRDETCLAGVSEVAGGTRLSIFSNGSIQTDTLWNPWTFTDRKAAIVDRDVAAQALRETIRACVAARIAAPDHALLKLSGGLDSSILAAAIAAEGRDCTCLTMVTEHPSGDERLYARAAAAFVDLPLLEKYRDPSRINLRISAAARLPRPTARSFAQESARIANEAADRVGATIVVDGGGGDNVFCSLSSVTPVADCLLTGSWGAIWPTTLTIAQLSQAGLATIARRAVLRACQHRNYRWAIDTRMLADRALAELAVPLPHPWLQAPPGTLPGAGAHIAMIVAGQSYVEGLDPQDRLPSTAPLLSQPIVELCLRVPSWFWFEGGRNRAVARRAFEALLPAVILERRSKGTPDSFVAEIYEHQRAGIRKFLLSGSLAAQGLLNMPDLLQALDDERPVNDADHGRIMQLVDVEAWLQARGA